MQWPLAILGSSHDVVLRRVSPQPRAKRRPVLFICLSEIGLLDLARRVKTGCGSCDDTVIEQKSF